MGFRFRKSVKLPGGIRINTSKSGIGYSYGAKGYRVTKTAKGTTRTTVSVPGTGISYVEETKNMSAPPRGKTKNYWWLVVVVPFGIFLLVLTLGLILQELDKPVEDINEIPSTKIESHSPVPTQPQKENSEIASEILSEYLGAEMIDFQKTNMGCQISIEISGISDRESQEEAPSDWDGTQRMLISAVAMIRDELHLSNGIVAVSIVDLSGETMVTIQNTQILNDRYNIEPEPIISAAVPATASPDDKVIVFITDSGSRYHSNSSCNGMKNPRSVTKGYARSKGYTACSKCY